MNAQINYIWKEHHDQLLNFIRKRVEDTDAAEDILQDVFLKILSKIETLKNSDKLKSWLFQITRNVIADYYRQKQKESNLTGTTREEEFTIDESAMREAESWVGLHVQELPDNYRKAVELFELKGQSLQQIANQMGISYTNARARVNRGRAALKKNLTDCCTFHVDVYGNILDYYQKDSNCTDCD